MNHTIRYTFAITTVLLFAGCTRNLTELTPSMETLAQTHTDVDVDMAMTDNQNLRMAREDLGRVWYTNRPSRLSPNPIVNTTGSPQ